MFNKLKTFFVSGNKTYQTINDNIIHSNDSFPALLNKLNTYFNNNSLHKKDFLKELSFINHLDHVDDDEKKLRSIMPYSFANKYVYSQVEVFKDEEAKMFYVNLDGKKLYYHEGFKTIEDIQKSFTYISAEQDIESPHRYLADTFYINDSDVVADLGAAEGNFALSIVEKVKEIFIVEADSLWIKALRKTFEPWENKVHIINKFAGDKDDDDTISLFELTKNINVNAIKMDIEGAELNVLKHAKELITNQNIKLAITTYHRNTDAGNIERLLINCNYKTKFSDKFILFVYDQLTPPYFRKGLIRAIKT